MEINKSQITNHKSQITTESTEENELRVQSSELRDAAETATLPVLRQCPIRNNCYAFESMSDFKACFERYAERLSHNCL